MAREEYVFGYGSLAAQPALAPTRELHAAGFVADLAGFARGWGVAMDNRRDLPGYKYYTARDGRRPEVFVAFLDLDPAASAQTVNGVCVPVDAGRLAALDRRERNYARVDVSDRVAAGGARVWSYLGRPEARERLRRGREAGTAVIASAYLRAVEDGFAALGERERLRCRPSLAPRGLRVAELVRHELGADGRPAADRR